MVTTLEPRRQFSGAPGAARKAPLAMILLRQRRQPVAAKGASISSAKRVSDTRQTEDDAFARHRRQRDAATTRPRSPISRPSAANDVTVIGQLDQHQRAVLAAAAGAPNRVLQVAHQQHRRGGQTSERIGAVDHAHARRVFVEIQPGSCRMYSNNGISIARPISTAYCVAQLSASTPALRSAGNG